MSPQRRKAAVARHDRPWRRTADGQLIRLVAGFARQVGGQRAFMSAGGSAFVLTFPDSNGRLRACRPRGRVSRGHWHDAGRGVPTSHFRGVGRAGARHHIGLQQGRAEGWQGPWDGAGELATAPSRVGPNKRRWHHLALPSSLAILYLFRMSLVTATNLRKALRLSGLLLLLLASAFVTGTITSALVLMLYGPAVGPLLRFWPTVGAISVVKFILLPWTIWEMARQFLDVCSTHDEISEIMFRLQLAGPSVVFAVCCGALVVLPIARTSFAACVVYSIPLTSTLFALLYPSAAGAIMQLQESCPPLGYG